MQIDPQCKCIVVPNDIYVAVLETGDWSILDRYLADLEKEKEQTNAN